MNWQSYISIILVLLGSGIVVGQDCTPPIVNNFNPNGLGQVEITWIATSGISDPTYNIRYRLEQEEDEILLTQIEGNSYQLDNLDSGQDYALFIQEDCGNETSDWNGPYRFTTAIDNQSPCGLNMLIRDNRCPSLTDYPIIVSDVEEGQQLSSVGLTIEHPWPADLNIILISPTGIKIPVVEHKGIFTQNFGSPDSDDCNDQTLFTDLACSTLENGVPNLQQSFQPLTPLSTVSTEANGTWLLQICDRAVGDVGTIKGVHLSFIDQPCVVPTVTGVDELTATSATITWEAPEGCGRLIINTGLEGFPINNGTLIYEDCGVQTYTFNGLLPDTDYEFYVASECSIFQISPYSCPIQFRTLCANPISLESFDNHSTCALNCQSDCEITGIWSNADDDDLDWIVNNGRTPTEFTGPSEDVSGIGNYLYIENQPDICQPNQVATLQSQCLVVQQSSNNCHLSFAYHRNGQDAGELSLSVLNMATQEVEVVWNATDNPVDEWKFETVDLSEYESVIIQLQFSAMSSETVFGDIGIDQIALLALDPNDDSLEYYPDNDADGFGNSDIVFYGCDFDTSLFTVTPGDCNDNDALINQAADEIPCNGIDENCNGDEDDLTLSTLDYTVIDIQESECGGAATGGITILPSNGTAPYEVIWSNEMIGTTIANIPAANYTATISDGNGCTLTTDIITVTNMATENYTFVDIINPSCNAILDGSITLLTSCGEDCSITWSNGMTGSTISGLSAGAYSAIINSDGCLTTTDPMVLNFTEPDLAGVQQIRPVGCAGGNDGRIIANSIAGQPLEYLWSTGDTESSILDLIAGVYHLTVTDPQTHCSQILSNIEVSEPEVLDYIFDDITTNLCADDANAAIQLTVFGGTPPYTYNWNSNQFTDDIAQLGSGSYIATVTDSKGCGIITETVNITNPDPIVIEVADITNTQCVGSNDGVIDLSVNGGTGELFYLWNDTNGNTSEDIYNLQSGLYSVTVVDETGCKQSMRNIPVMTDGVQLNSELALVQDILCNGNNNGQLQVSINQGVPPYNYNWSNGTIHESDAQSDTLSNLSGNIYTVTITDGIGCTSESNSLEIIEPSSLNYTLDQVIDVSCFGANDGSIELTINGGTEPYNIVWSTLDTLPILTDLPPGNYQAEVTDANDCTLSISNIVIQELEEVTVTTSVINQTNSNLGLINLSVQGGTGPYSLFVNGEEVEFTEVINDLPAGDYTIEIIDVNDCSTSDIVTVDLISNTTIISNKPSITIYPNPTSSHIIINSEVNIDSVMIFNFDGEVVFNSYHSTAIDMSSFTSGVYLVGICIDGDVYYHRVVKLGY